MAFYVCPAAPFHSTYTIQLDIYRWARGYSTEQLRMRYKHYRNDFDKAITQIVHLHPEYLTSHLRYAPASQADWDLVDSLNPNAQSVVAGYPETPTPQPLTKKRSRDEYNNSGRTPPNARCVSQTRDFFLYSCLADLSLSHLRRKGSLLCACLNISA